MCQYRCHVIFQKSCRFIHRVFTLKIKIFLFINIIFFSYPGFIQHIDSFTFASYSTLFCLGNCIEDLCFNTRPISRFLFFIHVCEVFRKHVILLGLQALLLTEFFFASVLTKLKNFNKNISNRNPVTNVKYFYPFSETYISILP